MFLRILVCAVVLSLMQSAAEARRVALVIGQNAYPGGVSATVGLRALGNAVPDAVRMAELLAKHSFEVISCDGKVPGCLNVDRGGFLQALKQLEMRAAGADLALVYFAGHGLASDQGNILAPVDARVNCTTGAVTQAVLVEQIMTATKQAKDKLIILDACRDNPISLVCPNLSGKKLSFTKIEAGAMQGLLLVTSTQFGQQALDGLAGTHSPFAAALFAELETNPVIFFEQLFNQVARATYEAAQKRDGFLQIPGKVVGGVAPADCLAGKGCVGDARMAALEIENRGLAVDASGVRNLLAAEEQARRKRYTPEERQKRITELTSTLARIGTSTDPLSQEGRRRIAEGDVVGGQAKLEEALDADEKAIVEGERMAAERRKKAARSALDLAVLTRGTDALKAVAYYRSATRHDPTDAKTWRDYAEAATEAGGTDEAKAAFEQAVVKAQDSNKPHIVYWATVGLGDVAVSQGSLEGALRRYQEANGIAEPIARAEPGDAHWQRNLSVSHERIGDVLVDQGNPAEALERYRAAHAIAQRLAESYPSDTGWQRDLSVSHEKIGNMLEDQGNLTEALQSYRASHEIAERLAKSDPTNAGWRRDLSSSHERVGDVVRAQGNLAEALERYRASLAIVEQLAKSDAGNASWQSDLLTSHMKIGAVLRDQGNLTEALQSYRASHEIAERLARSDPSNGASQRDLLVSHSNIADVLRDQGNLTDALLHYRNTLTIAERLAKADPGNASWQRDLAASHNKMGGVLRDRGSLAEALESYRASFDIGQRLAKTDPGNTGWQGGLAASYDNIGNVLVDEGNLVEALQSYLNYHAIAERLAKSDPSDAGWQRSLATSHARLGNVLVQQGKLAEALENYRASHAIAERLTNADPRNARWRRDLLVSHSNIADVLRDQGNLAEALESYRAALAIVEQLAKSAPGNANWQRDLALSHGAIAAVLARQGAKQEANTAFEHGRSIIAQLIQRSPDNAALPKDLAWFDAQLGELKK